MSEQTFYITDYCTIKAGEVVVNGQVAFRATASELSDLALFLKRIYKEKTMEYPKFFKMDLLSKLAFIGAEMLLVSSHTDEPIYDTALYLSNATSSLDTDIKHSASIVDATAYYPSPAVFVYTLANICLAEISIRHRLQGENAFFMSPTYDADMMYNYATYALQTNRATKALCGWVDYLEGEYQLVLYLVEKQGQLPHTIESIKHLF
ncbi:3-oxoacyl-ACP synthase [Myroides sp. 1354]|uniref:3-oxoacyl-ACP synthase n=1 Tax=unclassified Myroides TaxID=2642485 RepID=UPI002577177B|nr:MULTISPECIES: 3-oxoacyl-ACP synthase [unclassified Myroides]MDM1043672.1 3-oxoacyl-ACP synthase [Myroides sp. R163-1]MDM1054278.1 3-oxoacyl-ACP synthase [Myroides sp. 1354]MDM1067574.1 3-oxoacyl-ACP synthase [Myroides sp. 1372]